MSLFKKRSSTVVDLTALQKSGTLQRARAIAKKDNAQTNTSQEFIDLTNSSSESSTTSASPNLDFLSSIASASATESQKENVEISASNDVNHLKNKIEDLEYKLQRLIERLGKVEDKLLRED